MDVTSVCSPLIARTGSQTNTTSSPNAASITDADKVIKTQIDSTQVEEGRSEDEVLKGLLTDNYCYLCEAVLLFESQRLSHYEGKRHAQKLKVYLQTKKAEKTNKESTGKQRTVTTDKDRFCEMCNMVFSSRVVAKSHYEGIVHTKNLRKQGLHPPVTERNVEVHTPEKADQKSALEGGIEHHINPAANTEMDLKDPNKYCGLCAASFNNPQMALQHYSGRKHQRNQAKQDLIKELGDDVQQATSLMCQMCSVHFNSVEMYQAHMQGNKHQLREKKVVGLCKSQQKVYSTFADELADYIQVQKARGIAPKAGPVSLQGDTQKADLEDEKEKHKAIYGGDVTEPHKPTPHFHPKSQPRYQSQPGCNYSTSQYQGRSWPSQHLVASFPTPVLPVSGSPHFPGRIIRKRRHRNQSSSSSHSSSSSYSSSNSLSCSSSSSDSDDSESRHRDRRRNRSSRKERCRRDRDEEQRKRKHRKERENDPEERRRGESGESDQEGTRKKLKNHNKLRRKEKKSQEENVELEGGQKVMDSFEPEEMMDSNKRAKEHIETEMYVEQETDGQDDSAKSKNRKEKKKLKEKVDTRTEEEKLWDDSILGC